MVTYAVTAAGPRSFRVTAVTPGVRDAIVGDFRTLQDAEVFADTMRRLDAGRTYKSILHATAART